MSALLIIVLIVLFPIVVIWTIASFLSDAVLFLDPETTVARRLHRKFGNGEVYGRAMERINRRKPFSLITLSLAGLIGMAGTIWIILGK